MSDSGSDEERPQDEGMEFAQDIDDLSIVDQSAAIDRREQDLPSIDDFKFQNEVSDGGPKAPKDQWFTKVVGEELGPFPFDELVEMVIDEEVGPNDLIRHGRDGEWIQAGEIDGLFIETDDDDFDLGSGVNVREGEPAGQQQVRESLRVVGGQVNHAVGRSKQVAMNRVVEDQDDAPPAPQEPVDDEPHSDDDLASIVESNDEIPALDAEGPNAEEEQKKQRADKLSAWLDDNVASPEPEIDDDEEEAVATVGGSSHAQTSAQGYSSHSPTTSAPRYTPPAKGTKPKPRKMKKSKSGGGGSFFSGLSVPSLGIETKHLAILGVVALVFAAIYLPGYFGGTNDKEIYLRFKEIYAKVQQNRVSDEASLKAMEKEVIPEIEEIVKALEDDGAGSRKPVKQSLLFIGRNGLIPLIKYPGSEPGKYDERIEELFQNIDARTDW